MGTRKTVTFAAIQPLSAKTRRVRALVADPDARNQHFLKYNVKAATYDLKYCRDYGQEYLENYLAGWIGKAAGKGSDLALLPEFVFMPGVVSDPLPEIGENTRYRSDALALYRWSGRFFFDWVCRQAKETGMHIAGALPVAAGDAIYNTGFIVSDRGKLIDCYRKIHLPVDEQRYFAAGEEFRIIKTRLGKVGFAICYDIQFPEHCACLANAGAQIILHPSAGFTLPDEQDGMGLNRLKVRASDCFAPLIYATFAPEKTRSPRNACVIAANGSVVSVVHGQRTGIAVGKAVVGGKRCWPGDAPDGPDRETIRRGCRRPGLYACLLKR